MSHSESIVTYSLVLSHSRDIVTFREYFHIQPSIVKLRGVVTSRLSHTILLAIPM